MHWSMIHVDMTQQTIIHYDSLNALALDSEYTNAILDFITDQALLYQTNAGKVGCRCSGPSEVDNSSSSRIPAADWI